MENKAALRAKGENRMLQKSQEEPEKKEQRISDIHTHVLPGLDDGSKSISASVRMLRKSYRQGVRNVIATPSLYRLSLADKTGTDTETYGADGKSGSEGDAGAATV